MQRISKYALFLLAATVLIGCDRPQQSHENDEKAIQAVVNSYQEAYNQQDASKLAQHWASDAIYINPVTGESADGKEAIEKFFKEKFAQGKKRHIEIKIKDIEFTDTDEAIEHGVMMVTVDENPPLQIAYQADYVKENNRWLVKAIHEIELIEPTSNFEQLKDLSWLVGKWQDSDDDVDILFDNQWDKYKNFITQHFQMKIYGEDDIEGKQIIAWDSVKQMIRSWVFDSDGEFGEGTWEKIGKSWYSTMRYTLNDGRVGTSKNIYTQVDDYTYTFASIDREVDGEILPNINPVTVTKIK